MITFVLIAVALIALGILIGSFWTQSSLDRRFRQIAAERRRLNEQRRALRELRAQLYEHDRRAREDLSTDEFGPMGIRTAHRADED